MAPGIRIGFPGGFYEVQEPDPKDSRDPGESEMTRAYRRSPLGKAHGEERVERWFQQGGKTAVECSRNSIQLL